MEKGLTYRPLEPGMGEAVAARTILRTTDGRQETWGEVADRVAFGNTSLAWDKHEPDEVMEEYRRLRDHIAFGRVLMSGRHLQHGDALQPQRNLEIFSNCSTAAASFIKFYLLLNGSGVGRSYDDALMVVDWDYLPQVVCVLSKEHPDYRGQMTPEEAREWYPSAHWFEVPDSREGWAKAVELMERMAFERAYANEVLVLDFSKVRPKGSPIGGMQNRPASGPIPLMEAIEQIHAVKGKGYEPWEQAMRIDHALAACVAVGGARRAARIAIKDWRDPGIFKFIDIKQQGGLWSANNSIGVDAEFWKGVEAVYQVKEQRGHVPLTKEELWAYDVFCAATKAQFEHGTGEPGFINLDRLNTNEEGLERYADGEFTYGFKYRVDPVTERGLLKKVYEGLLQSRYKFIVNPCVTADTWVQTSEGPQQVSDLIGKPFTAVVDGKEYATTGFWQTGVKEVLRVRTDRGYELRLTANHKLLVERQKYGGGYNRDLVWVEAGDLNPGDKLVLQNHRGYEWDGEGTEEEGWLLGEIVGDNPEKFWGPSREVMKDEAVDALALRYITEGEKRLLPAIERTSAAFHRGFLRGLFDVDGSVQDSVSHGHSVRLAQSGAVGLERLRVVQRMLLRLGIASTIYENRKEAGMPDGKGTEAVHELVISRDNIHQFAREVGFTEPSKQEALRALVSEPTRGPYAESFTAKVVEVVSDGEEPVYDCTVAEVHRFDANGITAHNCGEIVLFAGGAYCVHGDTRILTRNGYVRIRDVVGQEVEVFNGEEWSKVRPFQTGSGQKLLRVTFSDGSYLDCTDYHRFSIRRWRQSKHFDTVEARNLRPGDILPSFRVPPDIAGISVEDAYTYGAFLGDGSIYERGDVNSIRAEIVLYPGKHHLPVTGTRGAERKNDGGIRVTVSHLNEEWLRSLKGDELPEWVFRMDYASTVEFIKGWLDTDGTYHKRTGGVSIDTTKQRALGLQLLLRRIGISYASVRRTASAGDVTNFGARTKDQYRVYIPQSEAGLIRGYRVASDAPVDLDRVVRQQRVVSVERLPGLHDTFCFTEPKRNMGVFGNVLTYQCVIADVVPFFADDLDQARDAFLAATRALIRTNLMKSLYQKEVERTNRIGVGMTGIHEFAWKFFRLTFRDLIADFDYLMELSESALERIARTPMLRTKTRMAHPSFEFWLWLWEMRNAVEAEADRYSDALGVSRPHTVATSKPAGCRPWNALTTTTHGLLTLQELFEDHEDGAVWSDIKRPIAAIQDGQTRRLVRTFDNGEAEVLRVQLSYGLTVESTANHPWYVKRRYLGNARYQEVGEWVPAGELKPGDVLDVNVGVYQNTNHAPLRRVPMFAVRMRGNGNSIRQPETMNPDLAWLLGYLWGDGAMSPEKYRLRWMDRNVENLRKANRILREQFGISGTLREDPNKDAHSLEVGNKELWHWLIKNGFYKYYEDEIDLIPRAVRASARDDIIAFIAGLVDADGAIGRTNSDYTVILAQQHERFSRHVQDVGWAVGLAFGMSHNTVGENWQPARKSMYLMTLSAASDPDAVRVLARHSTKMSAAEKESGFVRWRANHPGRAIRRVIGKVESVESIGVMPTYDVEVEDNHWFYAGAVKSHNTTSKLFLLTEGAHLPAQTEFLRWVQFQKGDPLIAEYEAKGYPTMEVEQYPDVVLVGFPTQPMICRLGIPRERLVTASEATMEEQYKWVRLLEKFWLGPRGNQISYTLKYDREAMSLEDYRRIILTNQPHVRAISVLPSSDWRRSKEIYGYVPEEPISLEEFRALESRINTKARETIALEDLQCASGACPL